MTLFTLYNITYLLAQALGVFSVYKLMNAFFDSGKVKKVVEIILFIAYYFLTSFVYLIVNIPLVNFGINLLSSFSLTFLYYSSMRKKIFVSVLIYVFGFCTEMVAVTLTGYINFPINEANSYDSIFGAVAANVLLFIVSVAASSFKSIKMGNVLPKVYWMALLTVPVLSLYILAMFFQSERLNIYEIASSVAAILIINFMMFCLYDRVSLLYKEWQESALIKQQNEYYVNQLLLAEDLHKTTSKLRHDIKNHLLTVNSFLEEDKIDEAEKHISSIIGSYQNKTEIVHTGYPAVDGLLNYKLQPASDSGVRTNVKITLPSDFNFSSFDLTVILGNLIDNALQAVSPVEENKFIELGMDCSKGVLIIKVSNSFKTAIQTENGKIVSSKKDKDNHGFGLRNVKDVLEKYNGTSKINIDGSVFTISVVLYTK